MSCAAAEPKTDFNRDETGLVPVDHCLKKIDYEKAPDLLISQRLPGRIAETQAAYDYVETAIEPGKAEGC